ncbi:MFS general substrate transporter [Teratosphaeria destructans]|uniref:MFS general substrate transporter n=1 Tax=Teratosphaeria destructans TaxID=418781 RepID=A0A9W7W1J8_9PEZI|nr:MFS general substrate transporter [Teratosphaeria destructans]
MIVRDDDNGHEPPTERSPLLSDTIRSIEPQDGIAPDPNFAEDAQIIPPANSLESKRLERQSSLDERSKQYAGNPEALKRLLIVSPALAIGVFLSAADQTIIMSSYGRIGSDLQALNLTSWIATSYFLTLTSFQPLYGKLSDIFGRKACLLIAYAIFGVGCLACGLSRNMKQLIAARAFAGIGGGGMTTVVSILLSDVVALRERGKWQGYVNIVYATGSSAGAPLGGFLADSIGWRWSLLIQTPLCLVAFIAVLIALKLPKGDEMHWKEKLRRVDFLGALILIAAVFCLLVGLDRGSNVSWQGTVTIIFLCVSVPLFVTFVLVEMKIAKEPFAPGHIIFNRSMVACYLCNFFSMGGWLAAYFYIPLYFQAVDGTTATGAGIRMIPSILSSVCGSLFGGFYIQKTGRFYSLTVVGYSLLTLGLIGIFLCSGILTDNTPGMIISMCIGGFGNGIGITTTLIGLIANAAPADQAVATACSYLFRSLGSTFGVAISATFANQALRNTLTTELPRLGLSEAKALEIAEKVRESLAYLRSLEPGVRHVVIGCYSASTSAAFAFQIFLVAGAAVSAYFIRENVLGR